MSMISPFLHLLIAFPAAVAFSGSALSDSALDGPSEATGLRATQSQYGPSRTTPDVPLPRHAYSPFDKLDTPPPYQAAPGRDYREGELVVRLAPGVAVNPRSRVALRGSSDPVALTGLPRLNAALAEQGITELTPVFPNARPPIKTMAAGSLPPTDLTRWYRARATGPSLAAVDRLRGAPAIEVVEPDYLRKLADGPLPPSLSPDWGAGNRAATSAQDAAPRTTSNRAQLMGGPPEGEIPNADTDPLFAQQWHLAAVKAPEAWAWLESQDLPPGGNRDIIVAVIDTGLDLTHPDLAANLWVNSGETGTDTQGRDKRTNGVDDDGNGFVDDVHGCRVVYNQSEHTGDPTDDHGHGTHVAGIIAAQAGNLEGGVGIAYNCQLMAIKAAQYSGVLASSDIAEAIHYAVQQGADVINMSFGGYARSQIEEDALAVAFGQCVLVAAAGNDGYPNERPCNPVRPMYPATYNWVLGVMASTPGGGGAGFSNVDCIPHSTYEYELMAPGVDIWSTLPESQYTAWDGTSMAAPIVSGLAALARTKWSDKDVYSSRFIMGQIAANAAPVADALASLTMAPKPQLSYLQHWLFDTAEQAEGNDGDGIVDAGETADLAIVIRNHWGKADPVTVKLEAWAEGAFQADPYVTWITDEVDYGAIGSFNWDDNGLIYDDQGVITGVRHPFRFTVSPDCPNDHVIPFLLTMACRNGLDPSDETAFTAQSRFNLIVQKGRELPRVISQDMTLSKDYYWLIPDQTLIDAGTTVTVTEGTQIQFWSADPSDPYYQNAWPFLQVEGVLKVSGTASQPVEMFVGANYQKRGVQIIGAGAQLNYTRIINPLIGMKAYASGDVGPIDHCCFIQDSPGGIETENGVRAGFLYSPEMTFSLVRSLGLPDPSLIPTRGRGCLFDANYLGVSGPAATMADNVFLLNRKWNKANDWWYSSLAYYPGYECTACQEDTARSANEFKRNAILNPWWDADMTRWMRFYGRMGHRDSSNYIPDNYWGTTSTALIDHAIQDYSDDFNCGRVVYQPILTVPAVSTYPFAVDVLLSGAASTGTSALHGPTPVIGIETATFTITFNRDMSTSVQPRVSFGPDAPVTDYTVHPVDGGWQDPRTWVGTFNITPITGDGYQLIRVAGAVAADDPWLVTGNDAGRFRFEIITSGTESMNLQATGGEGRVDLTWMQDDFDLLAGYNLYRSTARDGTYSRINAALIPAQTRQFTDRNVVPGQPYFYRFKVVKTDMGESDFSNTAEGTPLDTIPPAIAHTPLTSAAPGLPLTFFADVTDNVAVQSVTLFFRKTGDTSYSNRPMTETTGNRYAATVEGSRLTSPGLDYYLEATDSVSVTRSGRPDLPWPVAVEDRPVVTSVSPVRGPAGGGTAVTLAGANFKAGARVRFGDMPAEAVVVANSSRITCVTPPHFPATVDVTVTDVDGQSGSLLRGFAYSSDTASIGLPQTGGGHDSIVSVPVNAANLAGLASVDLRLTYDPSVLRSAAVRAGTLTVGWTIAVNTALAGEIRLSMASGGGTCSGSGTLAMLDFEITGVPGSSTPLHLTSLSLNDGAIPAEVSDGTFAVNVVYDVSGRITFWNQTRPVPGVQMVLQGDRVHTSASGADGTYTVAGADAGSYVLVPAKADDPAGITAYDASLALQHAAGLIGLTGPAAAAADVDKSGTISALDGFYILQTAAGLIEPPFPGAGLVWEFTPPSRSYVHLNASQSGQDFTAILVGDVSGNWGAAGGGSGSAGLHGDPPNNPPQSMVLALRTQVPVVSEETRVWLLTRAVGTPVYSLDLVLTNKPSGLGPRSIASGELAQPWAMAVNTNGAGRVRVAMAGAVPIEGIGAMLIARLPSEPPARLSIVRAEVNEGAVAVEVDKDGSTFDADTDGDGLSDWEEILAGTDPRSASVVLSVVDIRLVSERALRLTWRSVSGRQYRVESRSSVDAGSAWTPEGPAIPAADGSKETSVLVTVGNGQGYYRVRLVE